MKNYFFLFFICLLSIIGYGQQLQLEKASPFTAVKWTNDMPIVQYENEWYELLQLGNHTATALIAFCKEQYGDKWKKRFSEDLVEVLKAMGTPPNTQVKLVLSKRTSQKEVLGTYTRQNRDQVWAYSKAQEHIIKTMPAAQAMADISEFQNSLENQSSYIQITDYDYKAALKNLKTKVKASQNPIDINWLAHELAQIMAEIGDRHSSVKNEGMVPIGETSANWQLPFSLASLQHEAVALNWLETKEHYGYVYKKYPFVKTINGKSITKLIDSLAYRSKKAPKEAKFSRGLAEIEELGMLHFKNNLKLKKEITLRFTNGKTDTIVKLQLQNKNIQYESALKRTLALTSKAIQQGDFTTMARRLSGNIGYIALPRMYHFKDIQGLEQYIDSTLISFLNTKALIIDLRFNPGGRRDLIQKFAKYLIPKSHSPWVANVAYLRTSQKHEVHASMSNRLLYPKNSKVFNDQDKRAIDVFLKNFKSQRSFDKSKFSAPHVMVLKSGDTPYKKPVYILVNQDSFSAATVFTSAFATLPNVQIVGVTTDGSSGNSGVIHLSNSSIRLRVSTMLSFQRNGSTLDGNGTEPEIYIPEPERQILYGSDQQLQQLLKIINAQ
ncbi:S41 family peptidase [Sediminibacter sp. Hel_I_10]|uniref:S41 family peptidase n=1 Tax=Sediminibacter sp. Hel_I_10 TaxID=1392490 RepID=UPI00056843CC|nr:S41 family peptidase [Sediminibacter sp. Hel_I_10]